MEAGLLGENGGSAPELVEVDGEEENGILQILHLITSASEKCMKMIYIMTWRGVTPRIALVSISIMQGTRYQL